MPGKPTVFDPLKHCGAKTQLGRGGPCKNRQGFRTIHPGKGRCYKHGGLKLGDKRLTRGTRTTTIKNASIQQRIFELRAENIDVLDLIQPCELLRALIEDYIDRHTALMDSFEEWHRTHNPAYQAAMTARTPEEGARALIALREAAKWDRPKQLPDIASAAILIDRLRRMVETIHNMRLRDSIGLKFVEIIMSEMGAVLLRYINDPETVRAITAEWGEIRIDTNARGGDKPN